MLRKQVYISEEHQAYLKQVKDRDGVPESVTIRKALDAWMESNPDSPIKTVRGGKMMVDYEIPEDEDEG